MDDKRFQKVTKALSEYIAELQNRLQLPKVKARR